MDEKFPSGLICLVDVIGVGVVGIGVGVSVSVGVSVGDVVVVVNNVDIVGIDASLTL